MGAIQERTGNNGDKSYRVQIRIKGARPLSESFKRKTDAKEWMLRTEAAIREGRYFDNHESKKHSFSDLVARYKRDYFHQRKSTGTPAQTLKWWEDRIGHLRLDQITTPLLRENWDSLANTPSKRTGILLSNRTLNSYLETLSAMFSVAVREYGWMRDNPLSRIKKKPLNNQRTRFLDDGELKAFLKAVNENDNSYLKPAVLIALSTGGRQSEVMGLKWSDVDLKSGKVTFRDTKNGDTRSVALGRSALSALKEHSKVRRLDSAYVFPNRRPRWKLGKAKNQRPWEDITAAFRRARDKAQLENFRWHVIFPRFGGHSL